MSDMVVFANTGMQADVAALKSTIQSNLMLFKYEHKEPISLMASAQMLSNTLYSKRFFPYYAFNLVAGLDKKGFGAAYVYDAIGSFERKAFGCQ